MAIDVIDNWLPEQYFNELYNLVFSSSFTWNYNECSVYRSEKELLDVNEYQFTHTLYANSKPRSNYYDQFSQLFFSLKASVLLKAKLNLNPSTIEIREKSFHIDIPNLVEKNILYKTGILYFNDNNGYTKFKNGNKVESKKNRLVIFNGNLEHSGTTCTDDKVRIVLNVNWI